MKLISHIIVCWYVYTAISDKVVKVVKTEAGFVLSWLDTLVCWHVVS
jgi:hypothetical protein